MRSFVNLRTMFRSLLLLLLCAPAAFAVEVKFDFNETRENETPAGFRSTLTGKGEPANWKVVKTDVPPIVAPLSTKAPVELKQLALAQLSTDRNDTRAPMLVYEADAYTDFTFSTRFKIASGEVEQMAGIAFRIQDEKNYYYVRVNAKDRNVAFFRYVEGELIGPISVPADVKTNEWHQLTIECRGSKFRALLNDRESIPWTEPNLVPFPDGTSKGVFPTGKIAFWTKADSVVYFANARLDYTPREPFAQALVRETMAVHPRLIGLKIFGMTTNGSGTKIIASTNEKEIGEPGEHIERECIEKGGTYFGKGKEVAVVTMPLHDRNGETVGAVRVVMTTFPGQMEKNAVARALPIVKSMAARVSSAKELLQ